MTNQIPAVPISLPYLLHLLELTLHLLRSRKASGMRVGEAPAARLFFKHPEFFRSRPLHIAHQRHRNDLALRLFLLGNIAPLPFTITNVPLILEPRASQAPTGEIPWPGRRG